MHLVGRPQSDADMMAVLVVPGGDRAGIGVAVGLLQDAQLGGRGKRPTLGA
jgi:hypothetical protein